MTPKAAGEDWFEYSEEWPQSAILMPKGEEFLRWIGSGPENNLQFLLLPNILALEIFCEFYSPTAKIEWMRENSTGNHLRINVLGKVQGVLDIKVIQQRIYFVNTKQVIERLIHGALSEWPLPLGGELPNKIILAANWAGAEPA